MSLSEFKKEPRLPDAYVETIIKKLEKSFNIFVSIGQMYELGLDYHEYVRQMHEHGFHLVKKVRGVVITRPKGE